MNSLIKKIDRFDKWAKSYIRRQPRTTLLSKLRDYAILARAYFVQHFSLDEMEYYNYLDLSKRERHQLVPRKEDIIFLRQVNNVTDTSILSDKRKCYLYFKDYYHRDILAVDEREAAEPQSKQEFIDFVRTHGIVILKPVGECEGRGVQMVDSSKYDDESLEDLLSTYTDGYMAEEKVIQSDFMAAVHPASVNTIRINTVRYDDGIEAIWPTWRIGRGDSVVDNYSAGGISVTIDAQTGITQRAISKNNTSFTTHPDTNVPLLGVSIPHWAELRNIVCEMAAKLHDIRFVGWDMSLTPNGWVVIEANYEPDNKAWQRCSPNGLRDDFEQIKKRLGK